MLVARLLLPPSQLYLNVKEINEFETMVEIAIEFQEGVIGIRVSIVSIMKTSGASLF